MFAPKKLKLKANGVIANEIKTGRLIRPEICPKCKGLIYHDDGRIFRTYSRIVAHHWDYNKPLEIEWMCANCHIHLHVDTSEFIKSINRWPSAINIFFDIKE